MFWSVVMLFPPAILAARAWRPFALFRHAPGKPAVQSSTAVPGSSLVRCSQAISIFQFKSQIAFVFPKQPRR